MRTKICKKCKLEKPISEFWKHIGSKDGLRYDCKNCHKEYYKKYNKEYRAKFPIKMWCKNTISSHKGRNLKIKFNWKDLLLLAKKSKSCPICNVELDWGIRNKQGKSQYNSPTLDRINNDNYLDKDNVWIICSKCNRTKSNRTKKEFIDYCEMVYQKFGTLVVIPINHWIDRNIDKNRKDYGDSDIGSIEKIDLSKKIVGGGRYEN